MGQAMMSVQDIVISLKLTNLPTLLVEGANDMAFYRRLELELAGKAIDVQQCWGRSNLIQVFRRRAEFAGKKVAFLADSDLYLFKPIPADEAGIIWTDGYSIENDALRSFKLDRLFRKTERTKFAAQLDELSLWFSFEIEEALTGKSFSIDVPVNTVVPLALGKLCPKFCAARGYRAATHPSAVTINADKKRFIRGKNVLELVTRFLCANGRKPAHTPGGILELGIALADQGSPVDKLISQILAAF